MTVMLVEMVVGQTMEVVRMGQLAQKVISGIWCAQEVHFFLSTHDVRRMSET